MIDDSFASHRALRMSPAVRIGLTERLAEVNKAHQLVAAGGFARGAMHVHTSAMPAYVTAHRWNETRNPTLLASMHGSVGALSAASKITTVQSLLPRINASLTRIDELRPTFNVASRAARFNLAFFPTSNWALPPLQFARFVRMHDMVGSVLRRWRDLVESCTFTGRDFGLRALCAASRAKRAVLEGRWDEVKQFVCDWLGFSHPTQAHIEAAADALLEPGWEPNDHRTADCLPVRDVLDKLRLQTKRGTRSHKRISETRINGYAVALLDQPLATSESGPVTLLDIIADRHSSETLAYGFDDPRLNRVLPLMTAAERAVCLAKGGSDGTWAEAAVEAGFTRKFGETVRRKRTRLVAEVARRSAASRAPVG